MLDMLIGSSAAEVKDTSGEGLKKRGFPRVEWTGKKPTGMIDSMMQ